LTKTTPAVHVSQHPAEKTTPQDTSEQPAIVLTTTLSAERKTFLDDVPIVSKQPDYDVEINLFVQSTAVKSSNDESDNGNNIAVTALSENTSRDTMVPLNDEDDVI